MSEDAAPPLEPSANRSSWMLPAGVGLGLVAAHGALIRATAGLDHASAQTIASVLPLIAWLAVPTGLLLLAGPRLVRAAPTAALWLLLIGVGLAMRLAWFGTVPPLEDDYQRYLWDGAVVAHGLDPHAYAPQQVSAGAAPAAYQRLAALPGAAEVLTAVNFPDLRTIYPSVAQAAFAIAHLIAPFEVDGLRLVFLLAEGATLALLLALVRTLGASPLWAALYWWNPLPAAMLIGLAHADALLPPLVLGALLAALRFRPIVAGSLVALAAGVKIWPLLLMPMLLWPLARDPRRLALAAFGVLAVLAVALGPVMLSARQPGSGLAAYAEGWSNNNAVYAWAVHALSRLTGSGDTAGAAVRVLVAVAAGGVALMAARGGAAPGPTPARDLLNRALVVAAATFYLSPAQFPWYAVWFLPLAALAGHWPLLLASATLPSYYLFFPLWHSGRGDLFFYGTAFLHCVPVLLLMLYTRAQGGRGGAPAAAAP